MSFEGTYWLFLEKRIFVRRFSVAFLVHNFSIMNRARFEPTALVL